MLNSILHYGVAARREVLAVYKHCAQPLVLQHGAEKVIRNLAIATM